MAAMSDKPISKHAYFHPTVDCPLCGRTVTENNLAQHLDGRKCRKSRGIPTNIQYLRKQGEHLTRKDKNGDPIEFRLTLDQYNLLLEQAGITVDDIGARLGKYCLCRNDDIGHYEMGNCSFRLFDENITEGALSHGKFAGQPVIINGVRYRSASNYSVQPECDRSLGIIIRRLRSDKYPNYQYAETS